MGCYFTQNDTHNSLGLLDTFPVSSHRKGPPNSYGNQPLEKGQMLKEGGGGKKGNRI